MPHCNAAQEFLSHVFHGQAAKPCHNMFHDVDDMLKQGTLGIRGRNLKLLQTQGSCCPVGMVSSLLGKQTDCLLKTVKGGLVVSIFVVPQSGSVFPTI